MRAKRQFVHVYDPSGYVGLMTLEAARQYAERNPQALIEQAERPWSQRVDDACKAADDDQERSAGIPWWMFMACLALYTYFIVTGMRASW